MTVAEQVFLEAWRDGFRANRPITTSAWADQYRRLSGESSGEAGFWRTARTPYMREIMDVLSPDHPVQRVVVVGGAQVGKTEGILNWSGCTMDTAPGPMMLVQPTVDMAENFSKERVQPMIVSTPRLAELVMENRSRDSGNTLLVKRFRGGMLKITGANSAAGLRSTPIRYLGCDEVDAYPLDVDGEGDPLDLAEKRTSTFPRRKILYTSTPTLKGLSRIEREYNASDQRRYYVTCPACGHMDYMRWSSIDYRNDDPTTARLLCGACSELIEERHKPWMLEHAEWRPTAVSDGKTFGYHLPGLLSPLGWVSWATIVEEFLRAKQDPSKLKVWVNTRLAETWEERAESVEPDSILARREAYAGEVPDGVGVLVASVDVQGDRLEWKVKGYGVGEESWLIATAQIPGDPKLEQPWHDLDVILQQEWRHVSGQRLRIECTTIDSGGHHTDMVYRYCRARAQRRVFAVKGATTVGQPLVGRPTANNPYRARLYMLCVDQGKEIVYGRLRSNTPGPGYMHMPDWVTQEYVEQLTAEKSVRKYVRGKGSVRQWIKIRERNEALDLEVYALAALYILGPPYLRVMGTRAAKYSVRVARQLEITDPDAPGGPDVAPAADSPAPPIPEPPLGKQVQRPRRRSNWVYKGWK